MQPKKIIIVDDHPLVIEGFKSMFVNDTSVELAGFAMNAYDAISFLKSNSDIEIAFLDINLPDISGIELCKKIKLEFPKIKCLALSTFNERVYVSKMIENGASGYLLKNSTKEEILEAIETIEKGGLYMNVELQEKSTSTIKGKPVLTRREIEVLEQIAEGLTNQEVADKLFISTSTVSTHRQNLLLKLDANNTASLIKIAAKFGFI
ncbi:MAG: response regulator transcription factor [Chitinophagales bacterium]